ncbi:transposon Ty3-G Gag-Pol polyprotein [Trichonephila clavipes]|nr:transposon Ty3-G Gag-Pol polyprotein [Trichonephila clavipes]
MLNHEKFDMFTHLPLGTFFPSRSGVTTNIPFTHAMSDVSYPKGDREGRRFTFLSGRGKIARAGPVQGYSLPDRQTSTGYRDHSGSHRNAGLKMPSLPAMLQSSREKEEKQQHRYEITQGHYSPSNPNIETIRKLAPPKDVKELQRFLGSINVYQKFIKDYAKLRVPLNKLLKKANRPQCNGKNERVNQTLVAKLRCKVNSTTKTPWTKLLEQVTYEYNNSPHDVTGFPPAYLMFGTLPYDSPLPNQVKIKLSTYTTS